MNKVELVGRLTKDPTIKYNGDMCVARFTMACDRRYKKDGQPSADFISCVAFGKTAEFIEKYARKGMKFVLVGRITTGSYEKEGKTIYTTDVTVEEIEFGESKNNSQPKPEENPNDEFMTVPDDVDAQLPFN